MSVCDCDPGDPDVSPPGPRVFPDTGGNTQSSLLAARVTRIFQTDYPQAPGSDWEWRVWVRCGVSISMISFLGNSRIMIMSDNV